MVLKKKPVWIDTDIGIDDAIAILAAMKLEELDIIGFSAVAGNTVLENTYRNARNVPYLCGKEYEVYKGADKPLVLDLRTSAKVHGNNGLGGVIVEDSPLTHTDKLAWDALYEACKEYGDKLKVVAIGPLTNIAITIEKHPDFINFCKEVYVMGGGIEKGNISPFAEFNFFCDPHAAKVVFDSGIKVHLFPLNVTHQVYITEEEFEKIEKMGNMATDLIVKMLKAVYTGRLNAFHQHDSCPLIYLVHPEYFDNKECHIEMEVDDKERIGESRLCEEGSINTVLHMNVDRDRFMETVIDCYSKY